MIKKCSFVLILAFLLFAPQVNGSNSADSRKVVYGEDDREDYFEWVETHGEDDVFAKIARESIVSLMFTWNLGSPNSDGIYNPTSPDLGTRLNLCEGQRYSEQISASECSGTLVNSTHVVTAGHCIENQRDCDIKKFVFNYYITGYDSMGKPEYQTITESDVYSCAGFTSVLIEDGPDGNQDWAYVTLDREVPASSGHVPVTMEANPIARTVGERIVMIGFPSGLPMKIEANGRVTNTGSGVLDYFEATADAFAGNSGSGVFNSDGSKMIGILVRGVTDYVSSSRGCNIVNELSDTAVFDAEDINYAFHAFHECTRTMGCETNQICQRGKCVDPECVSNSDCNGGICENNSCVMTNGDTTGIPTGDTTGTLTTEESDTTGAPVCEAIPNWDGGFGTCHTYAVGGPNHQYCHGDWRDGRYAYEVCAECGVCIGTTEGSDSTGEPVCEAIPNWDAGFGTCDTYGKNDTVFGANHVYCYSDSIDGKYAYEVCAECGACVACKPYSAEQCRIAAEKLGLLLGGKGYEFEGNFTQKGCYAYLDGYYAGRAYYGLGGTDAEISVPVTDKDETYRPLGWDCSDDDDDDCDVCVADFADAGGCDLLLANQDPTSAIPEGCDSCGDVARRYCTDEYEQTAHTTQPEGTNTTGATGCTLTGGENVFVGWFGPDTGSNHCNHCYCGSDGALTCTGMGCDAPNFQTTPNRTTTVSSFHPTNSTINETSTTPTEKVTTSAEIELEQVESGSTATGGSLTAIIVILLVMSW